MKVIQLLVVISIRNLTLLPSPCFLMKIQRFVLCLFAFTFASGLIAQEFSNKGKDFWLGYGYHVRMSPTQSANVINQQEMILYFTSDQNANVTVEIPGVGYARTYSVTANQVTISDPIPKSGTQDARITDPGTFNTGIHITSDRAIVAYAHIYNQSVSGASVLFPTNTLGRDYYSVNYTQRSNEAASNSFFFIVATEDNTTVEITPSNNNLNGLPVNQATNVKLNKGQIYNVMGSTQGNSGADLTGSRIRSISTGGTGGCKPIAVFSGSGKINLGQIANGSADNLFAQAFPSNAWGLRYLTAPTGSQPNNYYRICVKDPTTIVKLNGNQIPLSSLINGFYYQFKNGDMTGISSPRPNLIESDKPILVAQYCTTQGQEGNSGGGDPEMIYLSPVEQTINKITLYSASRYGITQSYINIIIKKEGVSSFRLDDALPPANSFTSHPGDPNYSYAMIPVGSGMSHSLYSDSGFNAIAYGFGNAESYGYNAGTNIVDLNPPINIRNDYAGSGITYSATCTNTPFKVFVSIPYEATRLVLDFGNNPNVVGTSPYTYTPVNGQADSTYVSNGRTYHVYFIPNSYKFTQTGTFPVTITATTTVPQSDGCSNNNDQEINDNIIVNDPPVADFSVVSSGCINTNVSFNDETNGFGRPVYRWLWEFGNGTTSTLENPVLPISNYTTSVKLTSITDYGCVATTTKTLELSNKPVAQFSYSAPNCLNTDIRFTDQSTLAASPNNNQLVSWIWNFDNGAGQDTIVSNAMQTRQYNSEGAKDVSLLVKTNTGCASDPYKPVPPLTIKPTPVAAFRTPEVCLADAAAVFTNESTISDGTAAQLIYKWTFASGLPSTTAVKNPSIVYAAAGQYTAVLEVTAVSGCADTLAQPFYVNGSTPKADFEITNTLPVCQPVAITIKNKSSVDFGNITRLEIFWDYANQPAVMEVDEDPLPDKLYHHTYQDLQLPAAQTYTIRVLAYSGGTCVSSMEKNISVYPQPKASFTTSSAQICEGESINFQNLSNGISSAPLTWNWNFGTAGSSTLMNPVKLFPDSGVYNIKLFFVNANGCTSDTATSPVTVHPNPKVYLKDRQTLFFGTSVALLPDSMYANSPVSYLWTPDTYLDANNVLSPVTSATDDITYTLQVTGIGGCVASDNISILVLKPPMPPNAFSPNGDGVHDTWQIRYLDRYPDATVEVYDRYGQLLYQSVNYPVPWDGTYKGKALPIGTYYYIINPKNGRQTISGSVTIIK